MKTKLMTGIYCLSLLIIMMVSPALPARDNVQAQSAEISDYVKKHDGYSITVRNEFEVSPGGDLEMENLIGDVTIKGTAENIVVVVESFFFGVDTEKEAEAAFERYRARVSQSGSRIEVIGQNRDRRRYVRTSYEVTVPAKFNVDVETMGGEVRLEVLEGEARLETLGGDVEASDVTGDLQVETAGGEISVIAMKGEADLETAGGDVELREASGGPFSLKTAGGEIILRSVEGDVDAETSGGDVEARKITGNVDLETSGGDISLEDIIGTSHYARTSGGDIEANNVQGDVELRTSGGEVIAVLIAGDVFGRTSGGDVEIDDVSGDVDVSTSGGCLEIEKVMGRLVGKTSGGDVDVQVMGNGMLKAPIRLSSSGGEINLILPSNVKATIDAEIVTRDPFADYTIQSDFKLKIEEDKEKSSLIHRGSDPSRRTITATGDINGGGPLIELSTSDGNINIESR